jgi:hypothetical protein
MSDKIKTRNIIKAVKILDKAGNATEKIKNTYIRTKDEAQKIQQTQQESDSPNEYAIDNASQGSETIAYETGYQIKKRVGKSFDKIKNMQKVDKVIKRSPKTASKPFKKTVNKTIKRAPKTIKSAERTAKVTIKTSHHAAKTTEKTAQATIKVSKMAIQTARTTSKFVIATAKVTIKVAITSIKAIIASVKGVVALIAAGGWIAVVIIILICMVGFIISFGVESI